MDLVATLRKKLDSLDDGDYKPGLRSVLLHIETGFRHLQRGQDSDDDTAFTDAIYRTNQAFEGSVKEAYRVLAGQDPAHKRPFDIENYLDKEDVFRPRVLKQFKTYRTEWRNPSAHDYKLDFDSSEALLALVSVAAFGCLLFDQIAERLAYNKSLLEAESQKELLAKKLALEPATNLTEQAVSLLREFCLHHLPSIASNHPSTEVQLVGALHGFISAAAPNLQVIAEQALNSSDRSRVDLMLARGEERLIIEVKRRFSKASYESALAQVGHYMLLGKVSQGVLLFVPARQTELFANELRVDAIDGRLTVLSERET